jgi:HSP20 family molecular chaperone IbpA
MYSLLNSNLVDKILEGLKEPNWSSSNYTYSQDKPYYQRVTDYGIELEMFVPGLTQKDVKVELEGNKLFIEANYTSDLTSYNISKTFTIGESVDTENINAKVGNGVLNVKLPYKKQEDKKSKRIQIL